MSDIRGRGRKRPLSQLSGEGGGGDKSQPQKFRKLEHQASDDALPVKVPVRSSSRLRGETINDATFQKALQDGERQARGKRTGGLGIPGGRKAADVVNFQPLPWDQGFSTDLKAILQGSAQARTLPSLPRKRALARTTNRKVEFQEGQTGLFSLHIANDIAGVWNSPKHGARVYDYPDLTPKFEKRVTLGQRGVKHYFSPDVAVKERRAHVARGLQHVLAGQLDHANQSFRSAGATNLGNKWINKFSTLILSERGRELNAGIANPKQGLTHEALQGIVSKKATFGQTFNPSSKRAATFVSDGGAESHRKRALTLKQSK